MASTPGATELLGPPAAGRTFQMTRSVRLGDVDTAGELRLDATARYLQDVATDDADDAGLDGRHGWVVRRTLMDVAVPPVLEERLTITTFCTGLGRSWAERSTTIEGAGVDGRSGASIRTVSVWVQVDVESGRPTALTPQFLDIYGEACAGRKVSPRLSLAPPPPESTVRPWAVRKSDLDPFDHVNNAANWAFVEDVADFAATERSRSVRAEMEFAAPVEYGRAIDLRWSSTETSLDSWLVADGTVLSAARLHPR